MSDERKVAKRRSCDVGKVQESNRDSLLQAQRQKIPVIPQSGPEGAITPVKEIQDEIVLFDLTCRLAINIEAVVRRLAVSFTEMVKSLQTLFTAEAKNPV